MPFPNISLTTLKIVLAVAEHGSISRAAAEMNIATSAASKRIRDLEQEFGVILFRRQPTGIVVTEAGEAVLGYARNLFLIVDRMRDNLADYGQGRRGNVRVSANSSAIVEFLPEALSAFLGAYGDVRIELQEAISGDVQRAVRDGLADIGIFAGPPQIKGLELHPFREDRLVLVVPSGHPLSRHARISFSDTLEYDHIGMHAGTSLHELLVATVARQERSINIVGRVSSFDSLRQLIACGIGIGVMPEACATPYAGIMRLKSIPLTDAWAARRLSLCVRSLDDLSKSAQLLVRHLIGEAVLPEPRFPRAIDV